MNPIIEMLEQSRRGDADHTEALFGYIKSFQTIILRGAGKFGTSFGATLLQHGIPTTQLCYWDIRAQALNSVNGIRVVEPFAEQPEREKTLVINCIPNGSISGSIGEADFRSAGYQHYLSGMAVFEAVMCAMKAETGFDAKVCIDTTFCNWCACKRLPSLLQKQCQADNPNDFTDQLVFPVATFAINQKCTLQCTHCGQYINHYQAHERINFPLERIRTDIDCLFAAVDSIGYVSIIGGEPFVHPGLSEIIELILSKRNFGVLGITTNGICDISDQLLKQMKNGRTRVIFSDYTVALNEKQKQLFHKNVSKIAAAGISYSVGQPLWATPPSLLEQDYSEARKIAMKSGCNSTVTCKTIQNGVYYPCSTTAGVGSHHIADYESDRVLIDATDSPATLRRKIQLIDGQHCYQSCSHCGDGGEVLKIPGEQGIGQRYIHINKQLP
jgi:organic radical activating enzyme